MAKLNKEPNKCKECKKLIREWNKTGLCRSCYLRKMHKLARKKYKRERKCFHCGNKIEPMILYPAGKTIPPIIRYPTRCYTCRQKINKYTKEYYRKNKK